MDKRILYENGFFRGKWKYLKSMGDFIRQELKSIYINLGKWGVVNGKREGVINTGYDFSSLSMDKNVYENYLMPILGGKDPDRSILNYLDSNLSSFTIILNWMNTHIFTGKIEGEQIDFISSNDWKSEIEKFKIIFSKYNKFILTPGSRIFNDIIREILFTNYMGHIAEIETYKRIKKFEGVTDIKLSEQGDMDDIFKGIDIKFTYNNRIWTIQCKKYRDVKEIGDEYYFDISNPKHYKVDLYSFYDPKKGFYMFRNNGIKINGSTYIVPKINKFDNI